MKILYQSRVDLFDPRGGDTFQMEYTKKYIEKLDPSIQIDIKPELKVEDIDSYDLVHLFNLDWICETYPQLIWAKKHNKPVVLSAIHHSEEEVKRFEKEARYDIRRIYNTIIPWQSTRDTWKNVYRSTFRGKFKKIKPTLLQIRKGIRNEQREIIKTSDIILVQTEAEARDIKKDFKVEDFKYKKVVNGVNIETFDNPDPKLFKEEMKQKYNCDISNKKILLSVGRIEPRKNQLNLIKAFELLNDDNFILVFIGGFGKNSFEYSYRFKKAVKQNHNIYYFGQKSQEFLASAMANDGIYIQASWFETTGLVSLEAALAGMAIVASGERVKEYLGNEAEYCDPESAESIKNAIIRASKKNASSEELKQKIREKYSWNKTAEQTVPVYGKLINHK